MADVAQDAEIQLPDVCERAWTADQEEEEGADRGGCSTCRSGGMRL